MEKQGGIHLLTKYNYMKFTQFLILSSLLLLGTFLHAEKSQRVKSSITDVTVFRQQARLTSEANINLPAGTSEVIFEDLSTTINAQSLQVMVKGGITLLSATYNINYLENKASTPRIKALQDSLETIDNALLDIRSEKSVYLDEEALMKANQSLANEKVSFTADQVSALANLFRSRMLELKQKELALGLKDKNYSEARNRVQTQLNDLQAGYSKQSGEIVLTVSCDAPVTGAIRCNYLVNNAGWVPMYDLRSEGYGKPVNLIYKANIYQSTGYDWKNVNLIVSSANPSGNNSRPIMNPRYVDYAVYITDYRNTRSAPVAAGATMNMMQLEEKDKKEDNLDGNKWEGTGDLGGVVNDNTVSVQFELKQKQDIPSDAKYHLISMDQYDLPATYQYHSVPKLDQTAFLLAKVTDWGKLNLLPGQANIFFEGAYVGESTIDPSTVSDTLLLSMGRDERINVKRIKLTELCSTKWISTNKKETYAYETTIRNTKGTAIDIEILDQIPVSRQEDIKVELESSEGAEYTADYGKLLWHLQIPAGQSKKIRLVYNIKYPKDKSIQETN